MSCPCTFGDQPSARLAQLVRSPLLVKHATGTKRKGDDERNDVQPEQLKPEQVAELDGNQGNQEWCANER